MFTYREFQKKQKRENENNDNILSHEKAYICLFSKRVCSTLSNALAHHAYTLSKANVFTIMGTCFQTQIITEKMKISMSLLIPFLERASFVGHFQ